MFPGEFLYLLDKSSGLSKKKASQQRFTEIPTSLRVCGVMQFSFKKGVVCSLFTKSMFCLFVRVHEILRDFRMAGMQKMIKF
jgi:hypothetical protein